MNRYRGVKIVVNTFLIILYALCSICNTSYATTITTSQDEIDQQWLNLLHMGSSGKSRIDKQEFFLSPAGKSDPRSELAATIAKFNADPQFICRYPARFLWMQRHKISLPKFSLSQCPKLTKYLSLLQAQSISIIFASSYFNSPSSMFGHTFLLLNRDKTIQKSILNQFVIDFSANIDTQNNDILYAVKGIFGLYDGYYNGMRYVRKVKEYTATENRDLWEYKLNFTAAETLFLLLHSWELDKVNIDYYFFGENCSYQILALLQVGRLELNLTQYFTHKTIPTDTIKLLQQQKLIERITYRPSLINVIKQQLSQLTAEQQKLVDTFLITGRADIANYSSVEQAKMLELVFQLMRYQQSHENLSAQRKEMALNILRQRSKLPVLAETIVLQPLFSPALGHESARVRLGVLNINADNFTTINISPAYHSLHDPIAGFLKAAHLRFFELELSFNATEQNLELLSIIDIRSYPPFFTYFPLKSWSANFGVERLANSFFSSQHQAFLRASYGYNLSFVDQAFNFYALLYGEINSGIKDIVAAGFNGGVIGYLGDWSLQLNYVITPIQLSYKVPKKIYEITLAYTLAPNQALHFVGKKIKHEYVDANYILDTHVNQLAYSYFF